MRLFLVNYEYPPLGGGAGNATRFLSKELARLGCKVCVLTSAFADLPAKEQTDGFDIIRIPTIRKQADRCTPLEMMAFTASALWHSRAIAQSFKPDVCLAFFGIPCGPIGFALKCLYKIPYAVLLRGGDVPGFQPQELAHYHRLTAPFIRFLWRKADAVIANSIGLRHLAIQAAPDVSVDIVENGVDGEVFHPTDKTDRPSGSLVNILVVGRLTHQKGIDTTLRALALCADSLSVDWRFTIVGDGPKRAELEALVEQLGLSRHVVFHGWCQRSQLPSLYQQADIFAFSSRDEGMPNVVLEAMASGLPIIATRIAGNEELVLSEQTGFLVEKDDVHALSTALARLIEDEKMRQTMGIAARNRIEAQYTWNMAARKLLHLCHTMCNTQ